MNWYKKANLNSCTFEVMTVLTVYPKATRAIVMFLDGPYSTKMGDFSISSRVNHGGVYRGSVELDFDRVTMSQICGKITNISVATNMTEEPV